MAEVVKGRLVLQASGSGKVRPMRRVVFPTKKGTQSQPTPFDAQDLHPELAAKSDAEIDGVEVELELQGGKPKRIRPVGAIWGEPATQPSSGDSGGEFHNPYNFVPAPPRKLADPDLGDRQPEGHDAYLAGRFSGRLQVQITTETPLLIPDASRAEMDDKRHKTFPVRVGLDGQPYLAPTSFKGVLRSAFEAVTNSRFAIFSGHDQRLAYRMLTNEGLSLVPVRIEGHGESAKVVLLPGTSPVKRGRNDPLPAAWLERYTRRRPSWNGLDEHGREVWAYITPWKHQRFQFWNVVELQDGGKPRPTSGPQDIRSPWRATPLNGNGRWVRGWVCINNKNIDRKHDERIFFAESDPLEKIQLTSALRKAWTELIANYQEIHGDEIAKGMRHPPALRDRDNVWSRHIQRAEDRELRHGTLAYADVERRGNSWTINALYPVNISRKLFDAAPRTLLPDSLRPALSLNELSPAERVFGWVNPKGHGAYRGQLRVGPVRCNSKDAVELFPPPGVPLAILGQPKPQQARFYVARTQDGEAQARGDKEGVAYRNGKGLRGRKVYPHHAGLPTDHWERPTEDRTRSAQAGHFQEYRRPSGEKERDDQNRSILGWVKPGTTFEVDLDIINLTQVELGALLWLLHLPDKHYFRMGSAKPLGFGSVRLKLITAAVADGTAWREAYRSLSAEPDAIDRAQQDAAIDAFHSAVVSAYGKGKSFEAVPFIRAFCTAATGFNDGLPTCYPRIRPSGTKGNVPPSQEGESFKWFVENERKGVGHPLSDLATDTGLPLLEPPPPRD